MTFFLRKEGEKMFALSVTITVETALSIRTILKRFCMWPKQLYFLRTDGYRWQYSERKVEVWSERGNGEKGWGREGVSSRALLELRLRRFALRAF